MEIVNTGSLSKLTFFNVTDGDYGNYTCVAINKLGSSNTSFLLFGEYKNLLHFRTAEQDIHAAVAYRLGVCLNIAIVRKKNVFTQYCFTASV